MHIWLFSLFLISANVFASNYVISESDKDFILRSKELINDVKQQVRDKHQPLPEWAGNTSEYLKQAKDINEISNKIKNKVLPKPDVINQHADIQSDNTSATDEEIFIFASFNMPKNELESAISAATQKGYNVKVIFKGLREDDFSINETALVIQRLIAELKLPVQPKVQIDPRLFTLFSIHNAPTMVYKQGSKTVLMEGLLTLKTFTEQSRQLTSSGMLGKASDVYAVTEKDILETIKERMQNIDWEDKKKKAIARYLQRHSSLNLPELAKEDDVSYLIDPRVKFKRDMTDGKGYVFAKAGEVVDPTQLATRPITLFVVDSTRPKQVSLVKQLLAESFGEGVPYILVSRLKHSEDFSVISELQQSFGHRIHLLQPEVIEKFQLQHTPAKIIIKKGSIKVTEFGLRSINGMPFVSKNEVKAS